MVKRTAASARAVSGSTDVGESKATATPGKHPASGVIHRSLSRVHQAGARTAAEDALTDEIRTDNADAPDASTLVPQNGAVVDDIDHRLNETRDPS